MRVEEFLSRLDGVKKKGNGKWVSKCPAHKDRSPSLSILEKPDGRILLHCFAECDTQAVLDALNLEFIDLVPEGLVGNFPPVRQPAHTHAAAEVLHMMAHEALLVAMAAEEITRGKVLTNDDMVRIAEAAVVLRAAAAQV